MSSKSKKKPNMAVQPPRKFEEIQKEYAELCAQWGEKEHRRFLLGQDINAISQRLRQVNDEAAKRRQMDMEEQVKKQAEVKQEEPKND